MAAVVVACASLITGSQADEILFKTGDKLSGTIITASQPELVIKSVVGWKF